MNVIKIINQQTFIIDKAKTAAQYRENITKTTINSTYIIITTLFLTINIHRATDMACKKNNKCER